MQADCLPCTAQAHLRTVPVGVQADHSHLQSCLRDPCTTLSSLDLHLARRTGDTLASATARSLADARTALTGASRRGAGVHRRRSMAEHNLAWHRLDGTTLNRDRSRAGVSEPDEEVTRDREGHTEWAQDQLQVDRTMQDEAPRRATEVSLRCVMAVLSTEAQT